MLTIKGFVTNDLLTNNTTGVVAPIGELSTQALTYAREKGIYNASAISPNTTLYTFLSSAAGTPVTLPNDLRDHILTIAGFIYTKSLTSAIDLYADVLLELLNTEFNTVAGSFSCGAIVNDGVHACPEWITWTPILAGYTGETEIKIWFSDNSFRNQYDESEIVVIGPLSSVDDFFKSPISVTSALASVTASQNMQKIQAAKNGYPETTIRAETYNYVNPNNSSQLIPVTWNLLIYGIAGDNLDAVNNAIMNYILANSTHTKAEWTQLFPDIFRHTEFILIPLWDQYALPNRVIEAGIYSPIATLSRVLALATQVIPSYPAAHINGNLGIMGHPYKSLQLLVVGSPDNKNGVFRIGDLFKDYIDVGTTSLDFNRMSQATKDWANMLLELIITAESMSLTTSMPLGMGRITRDGVLYASKSFNSINYLVAGKLNLPTTITGV